MNTKEILKNTKGITLVALVVTIVILLILAAVSVSTLAGDNGLFMRAQSAKQTFQEKEESDSIDIALGSLRIYQEEQKQKNGVDPSYDELSTDFEKELKEYYSEIKTFEKTNSSTVLWTITFKSDRKYTIDKEWNIVKI